MKHFFLISIGLYLLTSCGSSKKFSVAEIKSIYLEYNQVADLNFGKEFQATVFAVMIDGREVDVSKNKKFSFFSEDIKRLTNSTYLITKKPSSFDDEVANVRLTLTDKEETFSSNQSIKMNFKGVLNIFANGKDGEKGLGRKNRKGRLVLRDGKNGYNGGNGANGTNADKISCYVWSEGAYNYVYVKNISQNKVWKFKCLNSSPISINANGGNGGDGGKGGNGGDGQDGKVNKDGKKLRAGDGGDGGDAGNGGNGGNGGDVFVYLHPSAGHIASNITILNSGGQAGISGVAGVGGKGGVALPNGATRSNGRNGNNGSNGIEGMPGLPQQITTVEFDISKYR